MNYLFDNLIKKQQNKILCLAKNYLKHVKEMGGADVPPYPLVFGKPWSSLVWEPHPIKLKTKENHKIDHEGKLQ
jgi:2-keto-4-pentenoate hydratase/2-oxohepta-3-ene-1,7-dioic acid hydratase in catechol pathway